jgi:hypothetical protein
MFLGRAWCARSKPAATNFFVKLVGESADKIVTVHFCRHSGKDRSGWKFPAIGDQARRDLCGTVEQLRRRALQVLQTARTQEKQTAHEQNRQRESQSARLRGGYRTGCDV